MSFRCPSSSEADASELQGDIEEIKQVQNIIKCTLPVFKLALNKDKKIYILHFNRKVIKKSSLQHTEV